MSDDQEKVSDLEWRQRILCSDESCIGVIGPDGRCKECGKRYEGRLSPESDPVLPAEAADPPDAGQAPQTSGTAPAATGSDEDDEWTRRRLCDDENCIGVIGPDGRCTECGKKADGA